LDNVFAMIDGKVPVKSYHGPLQLFCIYYLYTT
jgi:hypothetical protein